mgnify:CR=1 FL=1
MNESNVTNIQIIHFSILEEVNENLRITAENLSITNTQLLQIISEKEKLIIDLAFIEQELKEESAMRERDNQTGKEQLEIFHTEKSIEIELIVKGNDERMLLLSDLHQTNLDAETERVRDGVIELEGRGIKEGELKRIRRCSRPRLIV